MTKEELHQKNLNLAKKLYQRYCKLMDTGIALGSNDFRHVHANLSMWFTAVEQVLKSIPTEKENTQ
jgi:hypothetical protein